MYSFNLARIEIILEGPHVGYMLPYGATALLAWPLEILTIVLTRLGSSIADLRCSVSFCQRTYESLPAALAFLLLRLVPWTEFVTR